MAQFDFFGTWEDSWRLLHEISKFDDVSFVLVIYDSPKPIFINKIDEEAKEFIKIKGHLYIWGKFILQVPSSPHKKRIRAKGRNILCSC